jgi:hypothetical protein
MKRGRSLRAATLPKGNAREVTVEARNEHRQPVLTMMVSIEIHQVDPEPLPPHARGK